MRAIRDPRIITCYMKCRRFKRASAAAVFLTALVIITALSTKRLKAGGDLLKGDFVAVKYRGGCVASLSTLPP